MAIDARYVHTNLIAQDWKKLVAFYRQVFGCTPATKESNLSGQWLDTITGVPEAEIRLIHLRLPGHGDEGPTLEVIRYNKQRKRQATAANRPGFGHIAFAVDDVQTARDAVIAAGGGRVGDIASVDIPGRGKLTEVYVTDPEGNIIELQKWSN
jgi:catechol 2,3-dioxygenase-like lactoylglutathione lyase family enzyme